MISLTLFSVLTKQSSIIVTLIPIVIAVLSWVFPFPAIGNPKQGRGNDNEKHRNNQHEHNSLLIIRILVSVICFAVSVVLIYISFTASKDPIDNTHPTQESEITSPPEITPEPNDIIQQPQDLEVYQSDTARFTVVASRAVKSYTWQYLKPGASWKNVTSSIFHSATTDTLTFVANDSHNGFQYRCIVRFEDGTSEVSDPAKLTVKSY